MGQALAKSRAQGVVVFATLLFGTSAFAAAKLEVSGGPFSADVGISQEISLEVKNTGDKKAEDIEGPKLESPFSYAGSGDYPGGGTCGDELAAGATCRILIRFKPTKAEEFRFDYKLKFKNGASETHTVVATGVAPKVICRLSASPTISKLEDYFDSADMPAALSNVTTRFPDIVELSGSCYTDKTVTFSSSFSFGSIPACTASSSGLCYELPKAVPSSTTTLTAADGRKTLRKALVRNMGTQSVQIPNTLSFKVVNAGGTDFTSDPATLPATMKLAAASVAPKCQVIVSGSLDPIDENAETPEVRVSNGKLYFSTVLKGAVGFAGQMKSVTWSGGPDASGVWANPTLGATSTVTATITTYTNQSIQCSIKVRPLGETYSVKLQRFGDCEFHSALREYYFMNAQNSNFQNGGYPSPLQFAGLNDVEYGKVSADIPFRGVMNAAASLDGTIATGLNGAVTMPPLDNREFSKAIIVARRLDMKTSTVSDDPVAWGILNLSDFNITRMEVLQQGLSDKDQVVFQVFLAHSQPVNGSDIRGTSASGAAPWHRFLPGAQGTKNPIDRLVPFVNDSCAMMIVGVPQRSDKPNMPQVLKSTKLCSFSKPYKFADFRSAHVALNILNLTPSHATHTYPSDLMRASYQPACQANNPNNTKQCWNLNASSMGQNSSADPFHDHSDCRYTAVVNQVGTVCGQYGCYNYTYPVVETRYKASCNVLESKGECGRNLAIRFSGYNQMMLASLGCAAKYDTGANFVPAADRKPPGTPVTATLQDQGILPYTSFGGSAPKHWAQYPAYAGANNGYACIPCRFATTAAAAGRDLAADTKVIPVDQDTTAARKPIYTFSKSAAPAECVKDMTFEVRYFGSTACDGVNDPPGNFCSSGNIAQQNCSTTDVSSPGSPFGGGGNIAGKFTIPVCPGSGFEYDSVSVSWSPIIVDLAGNGISISREFQYSIPFDIKGTGKAVRVDWPVNNDDVAFLVRPTAKGQVTSIKQLFGDHKAKNGFEALRPYDTNRDGQVDRQDKAYDQLALWFDRNRNGRSDPGEIESLQDWGVTAIPLQYVKPTTKGVAGRTLSAVYFNSRQQRFQNVEDHYFNEYQQNGKKIAPRRK